MKKKYEHRKLERKILLTKKILERAGYSVERFKSRSIFHLQAVRDREIRNIRVTITKLSESEEDAIKKAPIPSIQGTKEIAKYYEDSIIPFFDKI